MSKFGFKGGGVTSGMAAGGERSIAMRSASGLEEAQVGGRMSGNSVPRLKQLDTGTLSMSTLWASVIQPTRNTSSRTSTADLVGDRQAKGREVWCRAHFVSGAVAPQFLDY